MPVLRLLPMLLLLPCVLIAEGEDARERAVRLAGEAAARGIDRARRSVRNSLEEELGLARTALEERETWFRDGRDGWLREFAAITREAVRRHDTDSPVFHGCCDWHSAVHGHWALMRVMRATGDRQDEEWIRASLSREGLEREAAYLQEHPDFEMPYGRAWFLRMAMEYMALGYAESFLQDAVVCAAIDVADSLSDYLEKLPLTPYRGEYDSDTWALAQLHAWHWSLRNHGEEGAIIVEETVRNDFLQTQARLSSDDDFRRPEFFSRWGNWAYLIARTLPDDDLRVWHALHPLDDPDPVWRIGSPHHLGMDWSRAWAIGTLAEQLDDASLRWSYLQHVEAGLAQRDRYAGRYEVYDHWVPQFAVYALTIDFEDEKRQR